MMETQGIAAETHSSAPLASDSVRREGQTAHLFSQIAFLHREVERLENQAALLRSKSVADARKVAQQYEATISLKDAEIESLQRKCGTSGEGVDFLKRCKLLEKQLATVNSEKSAVAQEKNDLTAKVRKLEAVLKARKQQHAAAQHSVEQSDTERSSAITALKMAIEELSRERDALKHRVTALSERLNTKHCDKAVSVERQLLSAETQTRTLERSSQACQVCTTPEASSEEVAPTSSLFSLRALLEEKTRESDDLRSRLDDLSAVQRDAMAMLDTTKRQLASEVEQRTLAVSDAENLTMQVRGLQQRCSDQVAAERMLGEKIGILEEEKQRLLVEKTRIERDRDSWEEQLRQYERDVSQLSATKNHVNQQLGSLANENEGLRAELRGFAEREAQMAYSLKAKDAETQEIMMAYRKAAEENEALLENQRFLERELDNARAMIASKEESVIHLQEQLQSFHSHEQQLTLDLQSLEYENGTLHQRLARADDEAATLERKCDEYQQLLHAKDGSIDELHRSLRDLSSQVIYKDNESLLLRQRCDELISDATRLRSQIAKERSRAQDLEESNARLVAREVLSQGDRQASSSALLTHDDLPSSGCAALREVDELKKLNEELERSKEELLAKLAAAESSVREAKESKERLHKIVLEQNKALALLAK